MAFKLVAGMSVIKWSDYRGKIPEELRRAVKIYLAQTGQSNRRFLTMALWLALPEESRPPRVAIFGSQPGEEP